LHDAAAATNVAASAAATAGQAVVGPVGVVSPAGVVHLAGMTSRFLALRTAVAEIVVHSFEGLAGMANTEVALRSLASSTGQAPIDSVQA
jgi:hypothetical protein